MRLINGEELEKLLKLSIAHMKVVAKNLEIEDDPEIQMEIKAYTDILNGVKDMPSAQPEIVRCKDCKHRPDGTGVNHDLEFPDDRCPCKCEDHWYSWKPDDNWFCGNGERRE